MCPPGRRCHLSRSPTKTVCFIHGQSISEPFLSVAMVSGIKEGTLVALSYMFVHWSRDERATVKPRTSTIAPNTQLKFANVYRNTSVYKRYIHNITGISTTIKIISHTYTLDCDVWGVFCHQQVSRLVSVVNALMVINWGIVLDYWFILIFLRRNIGYWYCKLIPVKIIMRKTTSE